MGLTYFEKNLGLYMKSDEKILKLEQDLRKVKNELLEREQDLRLYQDEVKKLNLEVLRIMHGLDRDLSAVHQIFKYLVPTQFPHISGFHFSTKFITGMRFSGDYLDVFEHRDKFKFNLIMSSCAGPSLTALLIAFMLKHGRDLGGGGAPQPVDFVSKVLDEIKDKNEKPSDIQLTCMLVDKRTYQFSYKIHGGGILSFFQDGETGRVYDLAKDQKSPLQLKPYDRVVMVSPGLVSASNSKGVLFSANPVLEAMAKVPLKSSTHDLRNEIFFRLDQHLDGRRSMQDVSIIIMSVDNNIIKLV